MAKLHLNTLVPSPWEVVACGVVGLTISLLGNSKLLISHYGLASSATTLSNHADTTLTNGLSKLDSYQATTTIVSFMVWAMIGLLTLSILQAIARLSQEVSYENNVSSNTYVHPSGFKRTSFWRQVLLQSIGTFASVALLVAGIILFGLYVLPLGLIYVRVFLLEFSASNFLYGLLGYLLLLAGLLALDILARIVRWRYKIIS